MEAFDVLTRIFGEMLLPESNADECLICRDHQQLEVDSVKDMAARAASEKLELANMIMRGARFRQMETGKNYYAISIEGFIKKWQDFVKRPTVNMRPTSIDNSSLICKHGQFVFDLDNAIDIESDNDLFVINEEEWAILHAMYGGGPKVVITKVELVETQEENTSVQTITMSEPSLCLACRNERILDFSSTILVIRVYTPGNTTEGDGDLPEVLASNGRAETPSVFPSTKSSAVKRKKSSPELKREVGTRRSKRVKAIKRSYKEIRVPVSKWDTVMELKLKIMQKTDIVPLYQKLLYEKTELENNESTIENLEIPPNAILNLVAFDQNMDDLDLSSLQDVDSTPGDEGGFGGTGLTED
ncbi:hypothetical protein BGZ46_002001, partial [Entomortierella lignicola]